jgi:proteasome assembly chaperone (PAC2) family protein
MSVRLHAEPELENATLIASWPGIGNIGTIAVDALRMALRAEEFGEIEPWEFFYPNRVLIRDGQLKELAFPTSKFYYKRTERRDLIFFLGEEQPTGTGLAYAEGRRAYQMANLVMDVAVKFGCQRVYTSGAAVSAVHHGARPRVWAVPNSPELKEEFKGYDNTILMSSVEGRHGQGNITGLNGLLLGVARRRGIDAVCVMGEIPMYLQGFALSYPQASQSVLEVLTSALGIEIDMQGLADMADRSEKEIQRLYESFPTEIRQQLDRLQHLSPAKSSEAGPITEEDKKSILEEIDRFFGKESKED